MKKLIGAVICSLVMSIGLMAASTASAEPHGYWMWCRDGSGNVGSVSSPEKCSQGEVKFISFFDGSVAGSISIWGLEHRINKTYTLTRLYTECHAHIVCGVIAAGAEAYVLGKLRAVWVFLRGLLR